MARRLPHALLFLLALLCLGFEWQGRLARLRRDLESNDPARRREVVRLLSTYSAHEVADALLTGLADPDPGVRLEAAEAAGRVRLRAAVPRLLDWLDESDVHTRARAARALGRIGDPRTVPSLVRALGDTNAEVKAAAVDALATIGTPDVVVPLLARLEDPDVSVRALTADALGRIGDARAVVPLIGRARDDAPEMRTAVYTALGSLSDERAVPALLQGLHDSSEDAKLSAINALGRLGSERAVDALIEVHTSEPRTSRATVAALATIGGDDALAVVVQALANPETRTLAREALVSRGRRIMAASEEEDAGDASGDVVPLLMAELTRAREPTYIAAIADVLGSIARMRMLPQIVEPLLGVVQSLHSSTPEQLDALAMSLKALAATGAPSVLVPLLERLRANDASTQRAALEALAIYFERTGADGRAADPLLAALPRVARPLRPNVIRLLGQVRARRAVPTLRPLLASQDEETRLATVEAIGRIGDAEGARSLLGLLDARNARTRFEAAKALARAASGDTVTALLRRLIGKEPTDRHAVVLALGGALERLRRERSLDATLARHARDTLATLAEGRDRGLAARAVDALARWGDPLNVTPLLALLDAPDVGRRRQTMFVLGAFDNEKARDALRRRLDARAPSEAAAALGEHGTRADAERLLRLAPRAPWPTSAAASFSLVRLARRGVLDGARAHEALCKLGELRDPHVRANVAVAMAQLGAAPCTDGPDPVAWLEPRNAAPIRGAAARWLFAAGRAGHVDDSTVAQAIERCVQTDLAAEVVAACREPGLPSLGQEADVYAYGADGTEVLADELIALRFADSSVLVTHTDANGHLRLSASAIGPLILDDPTSVTLEP